MIIARKKAVLAGIFNKTIEGIAQGSPVFLAAPDGFEIVSAVKFVDEGIFGQYHGIVQPSLIGENKFKGGFDIAVHPYFKLFGRLHDIFFLWFFRSLAGRK